MAKKKESALESLRSRAGDKLKELGYTKLEYDFQLYDPLGDGSMEVSAELVAFDETEPVILFASASPGEASKPSIQDDAKFKAGLGAAEGKPFRFVWVWDGESDFLLDLEKDAQISELPEREKWRTVARPISDSRTRLVQEVSAEYHRGDFRAVQRKFDQLHEAIYSRGGVKPTNAAIDELGKLLFLKIHLEKSPGYVLKEGSAKGIRFSEIFSSPYVKSRQKKAVIELKDAFREINNLKQYRAKDVNGDEQTIFSYDEPLRLENPDVLAMAIDALNLRDRDGDPIRLSIPDKELVGNGEHARMMRSHLIHEDLLGWAFDVFLRGKYASDEGLATYLTPSQVVECMARMAFHDITDAELWARRGDQNQRERWNPLTEEEAALPAFLCGDICCGTGRFLVGALREVKRRTLDDKHVGHSDADKLAWLTQMKRHSFFGADQAIGCIQKARINMLLYGEDHSQLLKVDDSITDEHIERLAGRLDLIMTNPPFGSGKYDDPKGMAKMRREDLGLELGWSWKPGNRSKRKELTKADPASLFIDRNLQLLKPGGRLLIVVPDGVLCNSGDAYIREYIMGIKDENTGEFLGGKAILKAVVSLPTETFSIAGTGAKTSFIYLQKKRHPAEQQGPVFMAVAEHVGYMKKGKSEVPDPAGNDLVLIAAQYAEAFR
ncbi:MAG: N-6 DNA methylase [Syntrophobacteraceae bacterium]|jgi:type I restriction enzyme M protein